MRPLDQGGVVIGGCTLVSTQRAGLGFVDYPDMAYSRPSGAPAIDTGRGWNRVRVSCPGALLVHMSVVVHRGRANVFTVRIPGRQ